jgi:hypothetical protein
MVKDILEWPYFPQKGAQFEAWNLLGSGDKKYIGFGGPRGGGKSYGMRSFFATVCSRMPMEAIIVREELEDLKKNHIEPMKQELKDFLDRKIIVYNTQDKVFRFPNGSKLSFMYCKRDADLNRFQGLSIDLLGIEEAGHFTEHRISYMISSVRSSPTALKHGTRFDPKVFFTFNWGGVGHKYLRRVFWDGQYVQHVNKPADPTVFKEGEKRKNFHFIFAPYSQNKKLQEADPDYQDRLRLLSPKLQKAYIAGDPDAFTGTFFNIVKDVHECNPFEIPENWNLFGALDPGTADWCSFGVYAKAPDGRMFKIYNYYEKDKNPRQHARDIADLVFNNPAVTRWTDGRKPSYIVAGRDAFARQSKRQINAHEYTWEDVFRDEAGLNLVPANTQRVQGANAMLDVLAFEYDYTQANEQTKTALSETGRQVTPEEKAIEEAEGIFLDNDDLLDIGEIEESIWIEKQDDYTVQLPILRFFRDACKPTLDELISLEHKETNVEDIKEGDGIADHAYDETRYAIMSAYTPSFIAKDKMPAKSNPEADYGSSVSLEDKLSTNDGFGNIDDDVLAPAGDWEEMLGDV